MLYETFGRTTVNIVVCFLCLLTLSIAYVLCIGLIYYDRNLNTRFRTLVNQLNGVFLMYLLKNGSIGNALVIAKAI